MKNFLFPLCISSVSLHNGQHCCFVLFFRDKLSSDDCVGTYYLPMSEISGQGEEGWYTVYQIYNPFFVHRYPKLIGTQRFICT